MAKNAVTEWSTTPASNTDIGGTPIQGTSAISNFDDAVRTIMAQMATFIAAGAFSGTFTLTSTDAGATRGPIIEIYRNSASPAAADVIGAIQFSGMDSGAAQQRYADIYVTIDDPTAGSEDSTVTIRNVVAGALTIQATITATGWNGMNIGATTAGTGRFTVLTATTSVNLPVYTVAGLPAAGTQGRKAYASNLRVFNGAGTQEGAGLGTGGEVTDNGTAWKITGTNITAVA